MKTQLFYYWLLIVAALSVTITVAINEAKVTIVPTAIVPRVIPTSLVQSNEVPLYRIFESYYRGRSYYRVSFYRFQSVPGMEGVEKLRFKSLQAAERAADSLYVTERVVKTKYYQP